MKKMVRMLAQDADMSGSGGSSMGNSGTGSANTGMGSGINQMTDDDDMDDSGTRSTMRGMSDRDDDTNRTGGGM